MKRISLAIILLPLIAGCTTPKTVLKNEKTGQVVMCGGSATGSMVGGVIGYHIQKSNDTDCVADHMDQGFKRVRTVESTIPDESEKTKDYPDAK
jgi:hypothetical protein